MASLTRRHNTWFANFALADGSRTRRSTKQKDLGSPAERSEAKRRAQQIAQFYEDCARGNATEAQIRKTMGELFLKVNGRRIEFATTESYLNTWLDRVKLHKALTTWIRYDVIVRAFLVHLGTKAKLPLGDIAADDIQKFLDAQLAAGRRPTSVRLCAKTISTPFGRARREGLILTNPVQSVELPRGVSVGRLPFTWPQVRQIFDAAPPDWRTAVLLGAFCGARLGDCANMPWSAVDLDGGVIRFKPQKTAATGKEVVMPIHPVLAAHLRQLALERHADTRIRVPAGASGAISPPCPAGQGALCPALAGRPVGGMLGLSREFMRLMQAAGVAELKEPVDEKKAGSSPVRRRKVPRLSFHSLRHTMVTALANAGVAPDLRQALAGHSSIKMSEGYTHRSLKLLQSAVEKLPAFEGEPASPPQREPAGTRGTAVPQDQQSAVTQVFPSSPDPSGEAQPEQRNPNDHA